MRKNVLALSIAAMIGGLGFAGAASADVIVGSGGAGNMTATNATQLDVAEGGVGHILLVPYFNAQIGNMTVLHVVNTDTVNGKAVKVRFRGAANSDDILDFQVFMSPGDVWTAAVTATGTGGAVLSTGDKTCTFPAIPASGQPFDTRRLNPTLSADGKNNNTREGYVEIFNMADIPFNAAAGSLYQTIKHSNGVATCAQTVLDATLVNYTQAQEAAARTAGFDTPTTGLMGDWYIINVAETATFSGATTAVVATNGGVAGRGNFVHFPQNDTGAPSVDLYTADPLFRTPFKIQAANYDLPDLSTPYVNAPANSLVPLEQAGKLTQALAVTSVTNEYATDPGITAKTDWVFSMPTRRYSVAYDYAAATAAAARVYSVLTVGNVAVNPQWFSAANTSVSNGLICVNSDTQSFWSREEQSFSSGAVFSPGAVTKTQFCGETSVLAFGDTANSVLGASVARQTLTSGTYINGWGRVSTLNGGVGLPILGASFIKLSNPSARAGVSGNYGITWPHRFTK